MSSVVFFFLLPSQGFYSFLQIVLAQLGLSKKGKRNKKERKNKTAPPQTIKKTEANMSELRRYRNCCCAIVFPGRRIKELPEVLLEFMLVQGQEQIARQTVDKR